MAWSNIFLQLTTLKGGPILGEGQVAPPFTGQIELLDFKWDMEAKKNPEATSGFGLSLAGAASSFLGIGKEVQISLGKLSFKKRSDSSSTGIMRALDLGDDVLLASITVLNIQNLVGPMRDPGYNLTVTGGKIADVSVKLQSSQMGAELVEDVTMNFTGITITYMRQIQAINAHVPTVPFFFKKSNEK